MIGDIYQISEFVPVPIELPDDTAVVHYLHAIERVSRKKKKKSRIFARPTQDTYGKMTIKTLHGIIDWILNDHQTSDFFSSSAFVVLSSFPVWKDSQVPERVWKKPARWLIRPVYLRQPPPVQAPHRQKINRRVAFCCWALVSGVRSERECITLWVLLPSGSFLRVMARNWRLTCAVSLPTARVPVLLETYKRKVPGPSSVILHPLLIRHRPSVIPLYLSTPLDQGV